MRSKALAVEGREGAEQNFGRSMAVGWQSNSRQEVSWWILHT